MKTARGLRIIAIIEAAKGSLVLLAGFGMFAIVHEGTERIAEEFVQRLHLNPASHYPQIFLHAAESLSDSSVWILAAGAGAYITIRFVEAWGLWHERPWAEWFGAASGALYVPLELLTIVEGVTWPKLVLLVVNIATVWYLASVLYRAKRERGRRRSA